jgi:3-dehydroquinate dehydratase
MLPSKPGKKRNLKDKKVLFSTRQHENGSAQEKEDEEEEEKNVSPVEKA